MGAAIFPSTLDGGLTPVCNRCGASESYDIATHEYFDNQKLWDDWICPDCIESLRPKIPEHWVSGRPLFDRKQ